ncbi:MAG: hypothetical protein B7Z75_09335 [Acidocella sp. 20-57-95]|nr:MAG: hypothetical protein B7Z75_09335 [Acidocella sp. 20-57-95]OYV61703.1 MAG: hypothetical protein B7Z71_04235 [Acidocella sp. 21-58-7]HQT65120.1 peptidoglycan-binding domain-containing protein [Acidocella sp.]
MKKHSFAATAWLLGCGLLGATLAHPALAADTKHSFAVHGIGAVGCADLIKGLTPGDAKTMTPDQLKQQNSDQAVIRMSLGSWLLGYVSEINRVQAGAYDVTPVQQEDALINMVAGVCAKHPDARVETVADVVFTSLAKAKVPSESPEVKASAGNNATVLRQSTLVQLEKTLVSEKLLKEADANGKYGPAVQAALVKFQTAQKLPVTGLPDPATVIRALVGLPAQK